MWLTAVGACSFSEFNDDGLPTVRHVAYPQGDDPCSELSDDPWSCVNDRDSTDIDCEELRAQQHPGIHP